MNKPATEKGMVFIKAGGYELFFEAKLCRSLERARAMIDLADAIVEKIKKEHHPTAVPYHLKQALMELGSMDHSLINL